MCEGSFVSLSKSDNCQHIFSGLNILSDQWQMMCNIFLIHVYVAYERTSGTCKIKSSKHLQLEVLDKLVDSQDVFFIQPTGSGNFESCGARTSESTKRGSSRGKSQIEVLSLKERDTTLWRCQANANHLLKFSEIWHKNTLKY